MLIGLGPGALRVLDARRRQDGLGGTADDGIRPAQAGTGRQLEGGDEVAAVERRDQAGRRRQVRARVADLGMINTYAGLTIPLIASATRAETRALVMGRPVLPSNSEMFTW